LLQQFITEINPKSKVTVTLKFSLKLSLRMNSFAKTEFKDRKIGTIQV